MSDTGKFYEKTTEGTLCVVCWRDRGEGHADRCPVPEAEAAQKALRETKARIMPVWADLRMGTGNELLLFGAMQLIDEALGEKDDYERK